MPSTKGKKELKAATKVAKIMMTSLQRFPKAEQEKRMKAILALKFSHKKTSKPLSTRRSLQKRRRASASL
jgi:hypothetical protein